MYVIYGTYISCTYIQPASRALITARRGVDLYIYDRIAREREKERESKRRGIYGGYRLLIARKQKVDGGGGKKKSRG